MNKRGRVVGASALMVLGFAFFTVVFLGGGDLKAASVDQAGFDLTKIFLWGGIGLLVVSAFLYISASAE